MALPASGQLSLSQIATELGAGSTNLSLRSMSATAGFTSPDAVSDFYGYAFDAIAPTVPTGLAETADSNSSISMSWNASTDANGVTGYEISIGGGGAIDVGNVLTYTSNGLACNTAYGFQVRAYDAAGNRSAYCTSVSMSTNLDTVTTPTTLAKTSSTNSSVAMSWGASTSVCGSVVYYYISINSGADIYVGTGLSYNATGLACNTTYGIRIRALSAGGYYSAYSASVNMPTNVGTVTTPTSLTQGSTTSTSIAMTWGGSTSSCGGSISYYLSIDGGGLIDTGTDLAYTASGLVGGTTYSMRILAYDTTYAAISAYSTAVNMATTVAAPPTPTNLTKTGAADTTVTMTWTASAGATYYEVSMNDGAYSTQSSPYTKTGLSCNATSYNFKVRACNTGGCSSPTANVAMTTLADTTGPTTPGSHGVVSKTTSSVSVSWAASTDSCTGVMNYGIYTNAVFQADTTATSWTHTSLAAGTQYSFYAYPKDNAGNIGSPGITSAYTLCTAPNLYVSSKTTTSITNSWDTPTGTSSFSYKYKLTSSGTWLASGDNTNPGVVSGLVAGTSYDFRVKAINPNGDSSAYSSTLTVVTNAADTTPPTFTTDLYSSTQTITSITLNWVSTDNVQVTSQTLYWRVHTGTYATISLSAGATSYVKTGLTVNTWYDFYILAADGSNVTNSSFINVWTLADTTAPSTPTLTATNPGANLIGLSWTQSTDNVGVTGYNLYANYELGASDQFVGLYTGLSTQLAYDDGYFDYYYVRAKDAAGNLSTASNLVTKP